MLAAGAAYLFAQSRYAAIQEISVTGYRRLSPRQVVEASGLKPGQSLFSLRPGAVAERVRALPWVKEARVGWVWPAAAVIRISERVPFALVPHHDRFLVVDEEGRVLTAAEEVSSWGLPLVTGETPADLRAGQFLSDPGLLGALQCLQAFPVQWRERVAETHAGKGGELVVYDLEGVPALLGPADASLPRKVETLCAIWQDLERAAGRAEYVDVRYRDRPIVKLQEGGGEGQ